MTQDIPAGLCQCGCGRQTEIAPTTRADRGWIKGQPKRFVGHHAVRLCGVALNLDEAWELDHATGCWIWQRATAGGYGYVRVQGVLHPAHRVFYERQHGRIPEGLHIDHLCRNRRCVNPDHLEPVTCAQNVRRGANVRLTEEIVAEIRSRRANGESIRSIGRAVDVPHGYVSRIVNGFAWKPTRS